MNATEDQSEPLGEFSELTMPRVVSLVDRQAQALAEIRGQCEAWRLEVPGEDYDSMDYHYADAGRIIRAILDRLPCGHDDPSDLQPVTNESKEH